MSRWNCPRRRARDTFRVTIHDGATEFRLQVEGPLGAAEAGEVEACWKTAQSTIAGRAFVVDLSAAALPDGGAVALLMRLQASGAKVVAGGAPRADRRFRLARCIPVLAACLLAHIRAWGHSPAEVGWGCAAK